MTKTKNGPIQAAVGRTTMGSMNWPVLVRMGRLSFGYQYATQIKVLVFMKKIRFLAKIDLSITVFPFLHFLTSLSL